MQKVSHHKGGPVKEDIVERFVKSIGIVLIGFILLYLLITTTQKHPRGIALKIIVITEFVAKGLFYVAIAVGIICLVTVMIESHLTKKRMRKKEEERIERKRQAELMYLKSDIESLKRRLEESKAETTKFVVTFHEEQARRVEFETHLKSRTAKAAVNEALGHFL
jgi:large-conductance mechanosensitive channel